MRTRTLVSLTVLFTVIVALAAQQPAPKATLVKAGRLLDVRAGAYRTNQGIWIDGGRIRQVGAFDEVRAAAPKDIAVIDLGRAAVLPGLIDVHTHLLDAMDPGNAAADSLILTLTKESPTKRALLGAAMAREILDGGFTTVRNVGHSGIDGDVSLRDAIRNGWVPGPRIVAAARKIAPYGGQALPVQSSVIQTLIDLDFLTASHPAEGRRAVLENLRAGADVIKVVADDGGRVIDEETMKAIADEAHRANLRVAVHAMTKLGIQSAIAAGVDSIEHGDDATDEQFAAMAREILDGGFTTVRNVGHSGIDGDVSLRDAIRNGWVPGPRIVAAARKIAPYGGQALPVQSSVIQTLIDLDFLTASHPAEGRRAVLENLRAGADVIKVVADDGGRVIDEETMKAIADEAHRANLRVAVHAMTKLGIQSAIAAGVDSIEHGDDATDEQFAAMARKGIVLVPTVWPKELLPVPRTMASLPNIDAQVNTYVAGERTKLDRARKAGVKIAFGSDCWFGFSGKTRGQMTRLVLESLQTSFGMTAADVLRSATVSAAELLNIPGVTGAVEATAYGD
ncbi:MAG: hypothetical protein AUH72_11145, partial [Acidobacteria bacterium 13_1_40CM_4_65_8]